jgi:glycosyltransferase involved in cell wall biosynthesis
MADKVRITFIITDLRTGGAEMMLHKLLISINRDRFIPRVISLVGLGTVGEKIKASGVPVRSLGMRPALPNPVLLFRLSSWLREDAPDLVQTWMYHADLIGGLAARMAGVSQILWGIRNHTLDPIDTKRSTIWTARASARLSNWLPVRIVANSQSARRTHEDLGYESGKMVVIPNGFNLNTFKPDPAARSSLKAELGLSSEACLIGLFARDDPMKDHKTFIQAAGIIAKLNPTAYFVLCGSGVTHQNEKIVASLTEAGVENRFHLLGQRDDMPRLTAAMDISVVSSYGEAFPNVIGEAMACAVPVVVTNVGDLPLIIGQAGRVVPPRDAQAMASAWQELLDLPDTEREKLGNIARQRVEDYYSMDVVSALYETLYEKILMGEKVLEGEG